MSLDFEHFLKTELNESQKKAVSHEMGPLLIVAGAGSGKTRVITARIAHLLLNHAIPSRNIIALTFTNRAAGEMKERVHGFIQEKSSIPFIGTFHSFCLSLLKKNHHLLKNPFSSILDEDDKHNLINSLIKKQKLEKRLTAKQIGYQISQVKNQASVHHNNLADYFNNPLIYDIYAAYEQEKRKSHCLDFDDLLLETLKLFEQISFKEQFQANIRHILIDEYQDTNVVQHALLKQMALHMNAFTIDSLAVVGDEDQSIYSWRGATVANMTHFLHDFPGTSVITIEQNYRTVQPILNVANAVIAHNNMRNPKQLWSDQHADDCIYAMTHMSEYQEAEAIALLLQAPEYREQKRSIAILYRAHFQSRAIEEALIKYALPYQIIGGITFYERKEIKDLLGYLKLIVNPFDRTSLLRVINCPTRGLGDKLQEELLEYWNNQPFLDFKQTIKAFISAGLVSGQKAAILFIFSQIFESYNPESNPYEALQHILNKTNYIHFINQAYEPEEALERIENIKELLSAIAHLQTKGINTLAHFLEAVALMQEQSDYTKNSNNPIILMTLHAAKGLEFDTIIIIGIEEGILPSARSIDQLEKLEEERRLFYVGITRAQKRLILSHARYRYAYGKMTDQQISRFFHEVPQNLYRSYSELPTNPVQLKSLLSSWFKQSPIENKKTEPFIKSTVYNQLNNTIHSNSTLIHWRINQPVIHALFGTGIIQKVEERSSSVHLTIKFKTAIKKIDSQFVKVI